MAVDVDLVLQVRMRYVGDDAGLLRVPPGALAKTLSGLAINPSLLGLKASTSS